LDGGIATNRGYREKSLKIIRFIYYVHRKGGDSVYLGKHYLDNDEKKKGGVNPTIALTN